MLQRTKLDVFNGRDKQNSTVETINFTSCPHELIVDSDGMIVMLVTG